MAKHIKEKNNTVNDLFLPGISNYDKIKQSKKLNKRTRDFHNQDVYGGSSYSGTAVNNVEADSLDPRYVEDTVYLNNLLSSIQNKSWKKKGNSSSTLFNLEPKRRRQRLRALASHDKLEEVLTKISDEVVVDGTNGSLYPTKPIVDRLHLQSIGINDSTIDKVEEAVPKIFDKIYRMYGFNEAGSVKSLWNQVYEFMVEGSKSFEYVYDDINNPKEIIAISETDPFTLEDFYVNGIKYWIHTKEQNQIGKNRDQKIILYDSQIVRIDWADSRITSRQSYLEGLIRSFNNLRIMDETRVLWAVTNSQFRTVFNIPTSGLSRINAAQTLAVEMARYHDDISYDSDSGELNVNGQAQMNFQKEYWLANGDAGQPEVTTIGGDGPELNNSDVNEYFSRQFYRNTRLPFSRFDASAQESWNLDPQSQYREEISLGRFIARIRDMISRLFIKPIILQLELDYPELKNDEVIFSAIKMEYQSYSIFEELMTLQLLNEKIEYIQRIHESLRLPTPDGDDIPFFSQKFLVEKYLPEVTAEDLKLNDKYRKSEIKRVGKILKDRAETQKEIDDEILDPGLELDGITDEVNLDDGDGDGKEG